jgi:Phorbol esters/diacylglycerol binding domain (C1 domain)
VDVGQVSSPIVSIQIEAAQEEHAHGTTKNPGWRYWSPSAEVTKLPSTNAPLQSMSLYYTASLTTPLLAAMLENIDIGSHIETRPELLYRFYRLLDTIVNAKVDAYLNFLEVAAYHTPKARHAAISILMTYWPKAIGHVMDSKPLPIFSYLYSRSKDYQGHPYAHQFVPWRFDHGSRHRHFDLVSSDECRSCSTSIHGFGLICPFCMSASHFDCYDYPEGNHVSQYTMDDTSVPKIAVHRFCHVLPATRGSESAVIRQQHHSFRLVNLFGLSLCFVCRKPLWGCTNQGLKCASCLHLVHSSCVSHLSEAKLPPCGSIKFDSSHVSVDWSLLRKSFVDHYHDVLLSDEEVSRLTYEEVSVIYAILWMQLRLLNNGVALGTIVIRKKGAKLKLSKENKIEKFELQHLIRLCETQLSSSQPPSSPVMHEYAEENNIVPSEHSIMFDWSNLIYIATVIKSPCDPKNLIASPPNLLNVPQPDGLAEPSQEENAHPFEVVPLSHMRETLRSELGVLSDTAAHLLLSHLHHLGLFSRLDHNPILFDNETPHQQIYCSFALPLGLDLSTDVETLVAAIEACLSDVDLSINEVGFLLLVRKLSPSGMASEYALRRLARSVLSWIVAEVGLKILAL